MAEVILRGGTIVTMDDEWRILDGDVACRDGRIVHVGGQYTPKERDFEMLDAERCIVMPGLVQSHVHTCWSLARGRADDLPHLPWLRQAIWPYEAALERDDVAAAAALAFAELLLGGTTAILDMGTVHHTDVLFEQARIAGLRATIGKSMVDQPIAGLPERLSESTAQSLDSSRALCERWHGAEGGRLQYAFAPQFVLSCSDELLREVGRVARQLGARIHTHASQSEDEIRALERRSKKRSIEYLHDCGLTGDDVAIAHCIWLSQRERALLGETGSHVLHCPSSNCKLGSGMAPVPDLLASGVSVSLGADGAPCNNNLDGFVEMRLAALIHKPRSGAAAMRAPRVVHMATRGGSRALGLQDHLGSLEVGNLADIITVNTSAAHIEPSINPYSALVYACRSSDVRHVVANGRVVVRDRHLLTIDLEETVRRARHQSLRLFDRVR